MVLFILIGYMEIAGSFTQFLFLKPLLLETFIFFFTVTFFLVAFPIFSITAISFVITFDPFRRRMAHTVGFAVIVIAYIFMKSFSLFICGDHVTQPFFFRFRGHTVTVNLTCRSVRLPFFIAMFIDLGMVKTFPYLKIRSCKRLSCFCTIFFQIYFVICLKNFPVAEPF